MDEQARDHYLAQSLLSKIDENRKATYIEILKKKREAKFDEVIPEKDRYKVSFFEDDLPFEKALDKGEQLLIENYHDRAL